MAFRMFPELLVIHPQIKFVNQLKESIDRWNQDAKRINRAKYSVISFKMLSVKDKWHLGCPSSPASPRQSYFLAPIPTPFLASRLKNLLIQLPYRYFMQPLADWWQSEPPKSYRFQVVRPHQQFYKLYENMYTKPPQVQDIILTRLRWFSRKNNWRIEDASKIVIGKKKLRGWLETRNMMLEKQAKLLEKQDETIDAIDQSKEEIVSYGNKLFINPFRLEKEKRCRKRKKFNLIFFTL